MASCGPGVVQCSGKRGDAGQIPWTYRPLSLCSTPWLQTFAPILPTAREEWKYTNFCLFRNPNHGAAQGTHLDVMDFPRGYLSMQESPFRIAVKTCYSFWTSSVGAKIFIQHDGIWYLEAAKVILNRDWEVFGEEQAVIFFFFNLHLESRNKTSNRRHLPSVPHVLHSLLHLLICQSYKWKIKLDCQKNGPLTSPSSTIYELLNVSALDCEVPGLTILIPEAR